MPTSFTLRARWVVPVDRPPIPDGRVSVAGGRIVEVGERIEERGKVIHLGDVVLAPGLVNAHTHLEFSGLRRPLGTPCMSLPAWIRQVIADRQRGNRDVAAAITAGLSESLASGVTSIGEIATAPAESYADQKVSPATVQFQEAIGFSAGRVESVAGELERRLHLAGDLAGLSPHAPYTVHPDLLRRIVQLAAQKGVPVAMHLAESREELQLLACGDGPFRELLKERSMWDPAAIPQGSRPLDYLSVLAQASRALVIHGNYLTNDEIDFVADRPQMSVVYCPRTHAYFGHEPYPLRRMLSTGVRVALGTDSRASNPDLDLLAEVRFIAEQHPEISPATLVQMATQNGADALGLIDRGTLTAGKRADLIAIPVSTAENDPYMSLASPAVGPLRVWISGSAVVSPGVDSRR